MTDDLAEILTAIHKATGSLEKQIRSGEVSKPGAYLFDEKTNKFRAKTAADKQEGERLIITVKV